MELDTRIALAIFCYSRQARLSLDRALESSQQWQRLLDYYSLERQTGIHVLVEILGGGRKLQSPPRRETFHDRVPFWLVVFGMRRVLNLGKAKWRFSEGERCFLECTLHSLANTLRNPSKPPSSFLVNLRIDLDTCEYIVEKRLHGLPELSQAKRIEHFCQAEHIQAVTLAQLGIISLRDLAIPTPVQS